MKRLKSLKRFMVQTAAPRMTVLLMAFLITLNYRMEPPGSTADWVVFSVSSLIAALAAGALAALLSSWYD